MKNLNSVKLYNCHYMYTRWWQCQPQVSHGSVSCYLLPNFTVSRRIWLYVFDLHFGKFIMVFVLQNTVAVLLCLSCGINRRKLLSAMSPQKFFTCSIMLLINFVQLMSNATWIYAQSLNVKRLRNLIVGLLRKNFPHCNNFACCFNNYAWVYLQLFKSLMFCNFKVFEKNVL